MYVLKKLPEFYSHDENALRLVVLCSTHTNKLVQVNILTGVDQTTTGVDVPLENMCYRADRSMMLWIMSMEVLNQKINNLMCFVATA